MKCTNVLDIKYLGKTESELKSILGSPELEWLYRGKRELIYDINQTLVTFALEKGFVSAIDHFIERRKSIRVKPRDFLQAIIRTESGEVVSEGIVADISEKSIAIIAANGNCRLDENESVVVCTKLRTSKDIEKCVVLEGAVYSVQPAEKRLVIIFSSKQTHSAVILKEFIDLSKAMAALAGRISLPDYFLRGNFQVVKSDRCCGVCRIKPVRIDQNGEGLSK